MKFSLLIGCLLLVTCSFAQQQHENWHFGFHVGVNFSSGSPVLTPGSQMDTQESCYSQSDASGNLLFYTNGNTVWDAANNPMPNGTGLLGNFSSQCMVIPKPGNPDRYYVLATDASYIPNNNGLTYSEIDMTLNGGMGDILPAVKNIHLNDLNGEWISAVPHANCVDTWIVTHGHSSNSNFLAFLVTSAGISSTPVPTNIGINITDPSLIIGIMKPSPSSNKIAMSRSAENGKVYLLDFDKSNGQVTAVDTIFSGTTFSDACYGLEFSRSGDRLYYGQYFPPRIFQFDMTASDIAATRTQIAAPSFTGEIGQLQIAPNDKIYVSYNLFAAPANFIGKINSPEALGTACGYVQNGFSLGSGSSIYGLPWYYNPVITNLTTPDLGPDQTLCAAGQVELDPGVTGTGVNYTWSDGSTSSTLETSNPGVYWVDTQFGSCEKTRDSIVVVSDTATIEFAYSDSIGCLPLSVDFTSSGSPGVFQWTWNFGDGAQLESANASHSYISAGVYPVSLSAVSAAGCILDTTIANAITVFGNPVADFEYAPSLPELGQDIHLQDQSSGAITAWMWASNSTQFSILQNPDYSTSQPNLVITLTVVDTNGCQAVKSKTVSFQSEDLLYVPNAFTPDGDGTNDVFTPSDIFGTVHSFAIYNRWGELIWSAGNGNNSWDGMYNNQPVPNGVYTWKITVRKDDIIFKELEGHVTLIR